MPALKGVAFPQSPGLERAKQTRRKKGGRASSKTCKLCQHLVQKPPAPEAIRHKGGGEVITCDRHEDSPAFETHLTAGLWAAFCSCSTGGNTTSADKLTDIIQRRMRLARHRRRRGWEAEAFPQRPRISAIVVVAAAVIAMPMLLSDFDISHHTRGGRRPLFAPTEHSSS